MSADSSALRFVITLDSASERLDLLLLEKLRVSHPSISRATLKDYFKSGKVSLDGKVAAAAFAVNPGKHEIELRGFAPAALELEASSSPRGCFLPVVYEDDELLVLSKDSGVPSIPQSSEENATAVNAALARRPELRNVGRGGLEPGVLHRLDTGTSGLLVFARTQTEFTRLQAEWKSGGVRKVYRALAGAASPVQEAPRAPLLIDVPLGHDALKAKRMVALRAGVRDSRIRGKSLPARTRILECREMTRERLDLTIEIETGVMHQIRCHLAAVGWPLLGDSVYRGAPSDRLWLHAWMLELPLRNGTRLLIRSALPENWARSG